VKRGAVAQPTMPYFAAANVALYRGDAEQMLLELGDSSVDCVVTSPPYYGQRDYGVQGQIGLEADPQTYLSRLIQVFRQVKRVLKPSGSLWVNIGDTYWSGKGQPHGEDAKQKNRRFPRPQDKRGSKPLCVPKQLLLIPHRLAIAMQDDGWIVRNDNVWMKPLAMPDRAVDRCAQVHEYVFHFVKGRKYYFNADAVAVPAKNTKGTKAPSSVWSVPPSREKKQHIATFPEALISIPVSATCPPQGVLLDPFCGSGTALIAALKLNLPSRVIGIDISPHALDEAKQLITQASDENRPSQSVPSTKLKKLS
jgi:site-specific DNA-methyltransferase (adenine-specific)